MIQVEKDAILKQVEFIMLDAISRAKDYVRCCKTAEHYGVAAICVPSSWVEFCRKLLPESVNLCAVIGSPAGHSLPDVKLYEAARAIENGANEIEMIINLGWVLSVDWGDEHNGELCSLESKRAKKVLDPTWHDNWLENVRREIEQMRHVCSDGVILKVSIESSHLNPVQKVKLCQVTAEAGADYVKLSSSGRELTDYYRETLLKRYSRPDIKIIGSVFINDSSLTSTKRLLDAGCDRVGSAGLMNELVCDENLARAIKFHIENSIPFLEPEPYRTSNTNPMNIYCDNMFGIFTEPVAGLFQRR